MAKSFAVTVFHFMGNSLRMVGISQPNPKLEESKLLKYAGMKGTRNISGVCIKHGAIVKACSHTGCTSSTKKRGVYTKHGTNKHGANAKTCSHHEGCTIKAKVGGVYQKHGAKAKTLHLEGCTNQAQK